MDVNFDDVLCKYVTLMMWHVTCLLSQWDDEYIYLIMEYCGGGDLSRFIQERRIVPENVAKLLLQQLGITISSTQFLSLIYFLCYVAQAAGCLHFNQVGEKRKTQSWQACCVELVALGVTRITIFLSIKYCQQKQTYLLFSYLVWGFSGISKVKCFRFK